MPLAAGTSLGPYQIEAPLGAGGMGEVYRARDTRLDRTVAIKVLPEHVAAEPDLKQRFEREAYVRLFLTERTPDEETWVLAGHCSVGSRSNQKHHRGVIRPGEYSQR